MQNKGSSDLLILKLMETSDFDYGNSADQEFVSQIWKRSILGLKIFPILIIKIEINISKICTWNQNNKY